MKSGAFGMQKNWSDSTISHDKASLQASDSRQQGIRTSGRTPFLAIENAHDGVNRVAPNVALLDAVDTPALKKHVAGCTLVGFVAIN